MSNVSAGGTGDNMVDTCPMTEGRARMLMVIDDRLTDSNFPDTIIATLIEHIKNTEDLDPAFSKVVDLKRMKRG